VQAAVLVVEIADDANPCGRRPHRKCESLDAVDLPLTRTQPFPCPFVFAFRPQMKVEIAERREKRIRLAERENSAVGIMDFQTRIE
jgi:hypothetical protein